MAKIVYYVSPIDNRKVIEKDCEGTLRYALKELGIEDKPLVVTINGMYEEELDVDQVLNSEDVVEIRRDILHGGGDSGTKSTLSTVLQIATIAAATYLTAGGYAYYAAAVALAGNIAAGALSKWALDLAPKAGPEEEKVATESNSYSVNNISNKARPLSPVPVVVGSHKVVPDVQASYYKSQYQFDGTSNQAPPYLSSFYPGNDYFNGPMATNNNWAIVPANYFGDGWPLYDIKIAPYGFSNGNQTLTPEENTSIINQIRAHWLSEDSLWINYNYFRVSSNSIASGYPIIIYHFHASDPWRGRFNFLYSLRSLKHFNQLVAPHIGSETVSVLWNTRMGEVFNGQIPRESGMGSLFYHYNGFFVKDITNTTPSNNNWRVLVSSLYNISIPPGITPVVGSDIPACRTRHDIYSSGLYQINGGSYTSTPKTVAYAAPFYYLDFAVVQIKAGVPISTQLFNFGIGDLEISNRMVGSIDVTAESENVVGYSPIIKQGAEASRWQVPDVFVPTIGEVNFKNQVINFPNKKLINPEIFDGVVATTDMRPLNFQYYKSNVGLDNFKFTISGRIYATNADGFISNQTRLQVQWKWGSDAAWKPYNPPILTITNDNAQTINIDYDIEGSKMGVIDFTKIESDYLEVRIRKANLDYNDNRDKKISELSIVDACFYPSPISMTLNDMRKKNAPMNIEGVYTTALITDSSTTNQYSAMVSTKCWVYNYELDSWSWTETRNPAFIFLYFCRGGFLNLEAQGQYAEPYSPTYGWVNYPGHPNSTEHIFGAGLYDSEIDIDKILEWGFFCNEHNLKCDMVIKDDTSVSEILEKIANIGRASVTYYGGKTSVVIEDPEEVPTCLFGMGNIIAGSFSVDYSVGDPIRTVKGTFVNRETWETEEVTAIVPFSDPEVVKEISITLEGITEKSQAQREINILAARQFYQKRVYKWQTDQEGYLARRGNLAYLSHDSTQYGFSGRVMEFIFSEGDIKGVKTSAIIDDSCTFVTIKDPHGNLQTYSCSVLDNVIYFEDEYALEYAPYYVNLKDENAASLFNNSIAEDFVFITDIKETTGKIVRISSVEVDSNNVFTFSAVDEDPSMWSYEFDNVQDPASFNDSIPVIGVKKLSAKYLGSGKVRLTWSMVGGDFVQIINNTTGLPIDANGQYSFSEGDVTLDLVAGLSYDLEVIPLTVGEPFKSVSERIKVWPL